MGDIFFVLGGAVLIAGGICLLIVMVRGIRRAHAWREEQAAIAECALKDQMEGEQLALLRRIHQRWPETIRIAFHPRQTLTPGVRDLVHGGPLVWETLCELYRTWPTSITITLHPRRHKMQICDAGRVGLAVKVSHFSADRTVRSNPGEPFVLAGREGVEGREGQGKPPGMEGGDWSKAPAYVSRASSGSRK